MKSILHRNISSLLLLSLSCALLPSFVPRAVFGAAPPNSPRVIKSFDSDWRFHRGELDGADKIEFDDSAWRKLDVPHDWSIEGPFDKDNPTRGSGGFLPPALDGIENILRYQRTTRPGVSLSNSTA